MFKTPLRTEKVAEAGSSGRARWRLLGPLIYEGSAGRIEVPADFETDFASVPRVPLAYLATGDTAHASAVVHDWLCHHAKCSADWQRAADIFEEAMQAEGVPGWRRSIMANAVRGADPYKTPEEPMAP